MGNSLTNCMPAQTASMVAKEDTVKPYAHFRQAAVQAATKAARCAAQIQAELVNDDVVIKKDKSPVTVADLASQIIIIHELSKVFPDVPFVAEEASSDLSEEHKKRLMSFLPTYLPGITEDQLAPLLDRGRGKGESTFWWTVDPIDGTEGFLRREQYAVCIALVEAGQPVLGVLACPALPPRLAAPDRLGCLLVAVRGQGCFQRELGAEGETQCRVAATADASDLVVTESPNSHHSSKHVPQIFAQLNIRKSSIKIDSQCKYVLVARGEAGLYLRYSANYAERVWDHAAGLVCVEEAGGHVTDVEGKPLDFTQGNTLAANVGIIASNSKVHSAVVEAVKAVNPTGKPPQ